MLNSRKDATKFGKLARSSGTKAIGSLRPVLTAFVLLVMIGASISCKPGETDWEPKPPKPEKLLSEEQMIAVLVDVHLAEGDNQEKALTLEDQRNLLKLHYGKITAYHEIGVKQLLDSYDYYSQKPLTMHKIYERVIEELVKLESEFN